MMPWRAAAVTGGYLVSWLALDFFGYVIRVAPGASVWNPANGLSLALVCVFGPRTIPLLLVGPLISGWLLWMPDAPMAVVANAVACAAGFGIAGWLLHTRRTDARLETLNGAAAFIGFALIGGFVASGLSAAAMVWTGALAQSDLARSTLTLWAGDTLGIFGLGPFFLRAMLWVKSAPYESQAARHEPKPRARPRVLLALIQAVALILAVAASPYRWGVFDDSPTQFILIAVVWIALSHGAAGAAVAVVAVNLGLLILKHFGNLPLALQDQQLLLAAVGIAGILVGAAVSEARKRSDQLAQSRTELDRRRAAAEAQKEIEINYSHAQEIAGIGSYRWDALTGEVWWSDKFYRLLGVEPGSIEPKTLTFHDFVHPDDRGQMDRLADDIRSGRLPGTANVVQIIRRDGQVRRFRLAREIEIGPNGKACRIFGVVQDITEEYETSRALRENRERGAAVAANMPGAVFQHRLTPSGTIAFTFVSDGVRRLFGMSPEEMIANPEAVIEAIHPDDRVVVRLAIENAGKAGTPWQQEFRVLAPTGVKWVRGAADARIGEHGGHVWDGILLDISAERSAAEELKKSEERFRRIASDAPMAIAIIGARDGMVRFANRACEEMFGYGLGELRDVPARSLCADLADFVKLRPQVRNLGTVSNREMKLRRRDGSQLWGLFSFMSIDAAAGEEVLACGFDSTALREAQATLSRQALDLSARVEELRCLYMVARLTNDSNRNVEDICRDLVDVLPQGLRAPRRTSVRIALRGEEFKSAGHCDGGYRLTHPIMADGEALGVLEVALDDASHVERASPFSQEERDLVETAAMHLGRMVAERDVAERLVQAQKLESLGQLTGGIAHDFNNLLTIIFGNLELCEAQCEPNVTLQKCIANAMSASRRAADLTVQLQAFSRRQALLPTVVQLNDLVSGMLEILHRTLGEQVEVVTDLTTVPTSVRLDPTQMETAILNLALNARDAMPAGGKMTVATRIVELPGNPSAEISAGAYVELSVSDTGTGMAPEVAKHVFEPFFTTKEVGKGSGLGLSMVFGYVKQSGGHIEVETEIGRGSTFRVCVPLVDEHAETMRDEAAAKDAVVGGEAILVVEDEPQLLDYLARLLRTSGYRTITATDAAQALTLIRGGCGCDLLLTDVGLPGGMNGVELARAAREIDPALKIVLASGYNQDRLNQIGAAAEEMPLVLKPFVRRDLLSCLRSALDGEPVVDQDRSMGWVA